MHWLFKFGQWQGLRYFCKSIVAYWYAVQGSDTTMMSKEPTAGYTKFT